MNWLDLGMSAVAALIGGCVGGCIVAFKEGRWRQKVEDRLKAAEERLEKGDPPIGEVPILRTRLQAIMETLAEIKHELREERKMFVPRTECDRRHEADAA